MLEEEEYLRTLIDADVSTLNGMSAGAIQDALKLLEAAQEANRPDQDAILDAIDLFMEKEADPNKPLQRIPTDAARSEEHTSELQSLMRISYAVFCLKKKTYIYKSINIAHT